MKFKFHAYLARFPSRWLDRAGLIILALGFITPVVVFFWAEQRVRSPHSQTLTETWKDSQGQLHVLGITLGSTTLREAEIILRSRSDIALFHHRNEPHNLIIEANFPSLPDHSRVVLGLDANSEILSKFSQRASVPRLYPNDMVRMNLATMDLTTVLGFTVVSLRLYPSADISEAALRARFGKPNSAQLIDSESTKFIYPNLNLIARLNVTVLDELAFNFHSLDYFSLPLNGGVSNAGSSKPIQ